MAILAFDIYGTLIDPYSMESAMTPRFGPNAGPASELWRQKQIEYSFRRALMRRYEKFEVCTEQALIFTAQRFAVTLSPEEQRGLLAEYRKLPAYPDVPAALERITGQGHRLVAFSNGTEEAVRRLLLHAGLLDRFSDVISVDEVKSFKPDPVVYEYLAGRLGQSREMIWLISSNPFDVIGAKLCGLRTVWLQRDASRIFDPWEFSADQIVRTLECLPDVVTGEP